MAKEIIPYNFDEIYANIEQKFLEKGYDAEEGSNTMQLVTAMSYLVSMLNANTAKNIGETLLPLARKRKTALLDARVLGYEIEHKQSYVYDLVVNFSDENLELKRFTKFTSGDKSYYYIGSSTTISDFPGAIGSRTIRVVEGTLKRPEKLLSLIDDNFGVSTDFEDTLTVTVEEITDPLTGEITTTHFMDIPFADIEENGIWVNLTYIDDNDEQVTEEWVRSQQFMIESDTVLNKEFVRLDNIDYRTPRIYFKLGDIGKTLRVNTIIRANVLLTSGVDGGMTTNPSISSTEHTATVVNYSLVKRGTDEEDLESIKLNAPLFNNTANRVITKNDYIAFCTRQTEVKYAYVWDGNDNFPPDEPGIIWFSFVPSNSIRDIQPNVQKTEWNLTTIGDSSWRLTSEDIFGNNLPIGDPGKIFGIFDELDSYKVPTLEFRYRQPTYLDFSFEISIVKYPLNAGKGETHQRAFDVIDEYFFNIEDGNVPVETFSYEYFQSNLIKRIDSELTDVIGFNMTLINTITFDSNDVVNENGTEQFIFMLGNPYEGPFKETVISETESEYSLQPSINTERFIEHSGSYWNLRTDIRTADIGTNWDAAPLTIYLDEYNSTTDIYVGTREIGVVEVTESSQLPIKVTLYKQSLFGHPIGLTDTDVLNSLTINVQYPSPNVLMKGNTIPRLKSVKFL